MMKRLRLRLFKMPTILDLLMGIAILGMAGVMVVVVLFSALVWLSWLVIFFGRSSLFS